MPPKKDNGSTSGATNNNSLNNSSTANTTAPSLASASSAAAGNTSSSMDSAEQRQQLYVANAKLCRMVRKHPYLYDRNHPNYAKKQALDKAWMKIAKDCNDSVASCKERWRNIRAAFARSINVYKTNGGPNRVKPYYLHKELSFLVKPMMEGREKLKDDSKEELEDDEEEEEGDGDGGGEGDVEANNTTIDQDNQVEKCSLEPETELTSDLEGDFNIFDEMREIRDNEPVMVGKSTMTVENFKSPLQETGEHDAKKVKLDLSGSMLRVATDADVKFLEALLPDMREMNARQKIIFKRKIYQSLQEVFETSVDFPGTSSNGESHGMTSTAQTVIDSIESLNESEFCKLRTYKQNDLRNNTMTARGYRMQNGAPRNPLTVIPLQQAAQSSNGSQRGNVASSESMTQGQVMPITIKDEVEDVDIE